MVTTPIVDVNIPLLGWTYIGGPSMHVLVALRDDDEVLLRASDAADTDDLDAVIDVLAQNGPRNAPSFVGLHLGDLTRVVAHGTTWVEVESPQGQRILTPPSARVWLDLDLEGQVDVVRLRGGVLPAQAASSGVDVGRRPVASPPVDAALAPVVAVLPAGPSSAGPRGWLSERDDAPPPVATPSSSATARPVVDALPSWSDHRPVLAGAPVANDSPPAVPRAAVVPLTAVVSPEAGMPVSTEAGMPVPPETAPTARLGDPPVVEADGAGSPPIPTLTSRNLATSAEAAVPAEVAVLAEVAAPAEVEAAEVGEHTLTTLPAHDQPVPLPVSATPEPGRASSVPAAQLDDAQATDATDATQATQATDATDATDAPTEDGYDHLFGRTVDRDAYLAKLVALGEREDEHEEANETVLVRPPAQDGPAALPWVRATARPTDMDRGADPAAPPRVLPSSDPPPAAPSAGLLISSVPWAARREPARPGGMPTQQPEPHSLNGATASPTVTPLAPTSLEPAAHAAPAAPAAPAKAGPPVGRWPVPQVPGASSVRPAAAPTTPVGPEAVGPEAVGPEAVAPEAVAPEAPPTPARDSSPVPPHPAASLGSVTAGIPAVSVSPAAADATSTAGAGPQFYSGRSTLVRPTTGLSPDAMPSLPIPEPAKHTDQSHKPKEAERPEQPQGREVSAGPGDDPAGRGATSAQDAATGPSVWGVLCPSGHPNPPVNERCRQCSLEIAEQQPVTMPRPSLGLLRLPTGDAVTLDRGVILGRAPKPPLDVPAASRPHVVRVASPHKDVSRTHLEVVLDGWQVLVRDLDATNGTTVTIPGRPPVRLRPAEPQVIEPGTRISLADEVELTFEVGP